MFLRQHSLSLVHEGRKAEISHLELPSKAAAVEAAGAAMATEARTARERMAIFMVMRCVFVVVAAVSMSVFEIEVDEKKKNEGKATFYTD